MGKKRNYGASEDSPDACFGAPGERNAVGLLEPRVHAVGVDGGHGRVAADRGLLLRRELVEPRRHLGRRRADPIVADVELTAQRASLELKKMRRSCCTHELMRYRSSAKTKLSVVKFSSSVGSFAGAAGPSWPGGSGLDS